VNISSSGAKVAIPLLGAYSASKFGLEGMSDALRRELMLFGIDVVIVEPDTVNTAMCDKGEKEDLSEFKPTEYWWGGAEIPEVHRHRSTYQRLVP
jgi:short-subunit dehydrogenase